MASPDFNKRAFLYRTTNLVNGRVYVGVRTYSYTRKDETYLGSGVAISSAIKSYGKHNFKRETLLIATAEYCYDIERQIVTQEWVDSRDNYNLSVGGWGGDRGPEARKRIREGQRKYYQSMSADEKQKLVDHLDSIRGSIKQKTGKESDHWLGYWMTPAGIFETCRDAAAANSIDHRTVRSRCRVNNNKKIKRPSSKYNQPREWVGKTWKELGWGFIDKEEIYDAQEKASN